MAQSDRFSANALRAAIAERTFMFDGAMGTYYASKLAEYQPDADASACELACVTDPETVLSIHRQYIAAGAQAVKTNTYGANTALLKRELPEVLGIIDAGWRIAAQAAEGRAYVFADIGPIPAEEPLPEYIAVIDRFIALGATCFLFETFPNDLCLGDVASHIKANVPDAYILASFAASPDGYTRTGEPVLDLLRRMERCPDVDALGLNCVSGPYHLRKLVKAFPERAETCEGRRNRAFAKPLSVMPNSGYPAVLGGRTWFPSSADYFAHQLAHIADEADIIGGCCGTTPEYIAATVRLLRDGQTAGKPSSAKPVRPEAPVRRKNALLDKLRAGAMPIAVELDPPEDAVGTRFMNGAAALKSAGADAITIADCPIARVRADSSMLAAKLHRELGIDVVPHMTCRDRNLNALRALLLGLDIEGIDSVLVVTGDPIPSAMRDEVKGVFNFNSVMLARHIRANADATRRDMAIFGALNVNAANFTAELDKALRKRDAGVNGFFTQPVFTEQAVRNVESARARLDGTYMLMGILPVVSYRNACFLQNEIAGIAIGDELVRRYEGLERAEAEALSLDVSAAVAVRLRASVDGYYIMTPFGRTGLVSRLIKRIRA